MKSTNFPVQVLTRIAVLVAFAVVLKVGLSLTISTYRFTFYDIPLMIIGIMFGPLAGVISGFTADWINIMVPNLATGFNLFTVSSMMWGFIPGILLYKKDFSTLHLSLVVILVSIVTFGLNTYQLYLWMGTGMYGSLPARVITLLIKLPVQIFIIKVLYDRVIIHDLKLLENK